MVFSLCVVMCVLCVSECVGMYIQCTYIHTDLLKEIEANSADYKAKVMRSLIQCKWTPLTIESTCGK